jgi:hypothetical protein
MKNKSNLCIVKEASAFLKRALPVLGLAGTTLFTSCEKDEPIHDVELTFGIDKTIEISEIEQYAKDPSVRTIYLVPIDDWQRSRYGNIKFMRRNFLQPRLDISPKVWGRGDFNFIPGEASVIPGDSLWYIQHGWTINKYLLDSTSVNQQ